MPDPTGEDASPSSESDWTGALSAWGVALQRTGDYAVSTLPPSGAITYGDSSNDQDLSNYDAYVLPEPNVAAPALTNRTCWNSSQPGRYVVAPSAVLAHGNCLAKLPPPRTPARGLMPGANPALLAASCAPAIRTSNPGSPTHDRAAFPGRS